MSNGPVHNVKPDQGGCWYCYTVDDGLVFCCEFDTYVHRHCAQRFLLMEGHDPEAEIICAEIGVLVPLDPKFKPLD